MTIKEYIEEREKTIDEFIKLDLFNDDIKAFHHQTILGVLGKVIEVAEDKSKEYAQKARDTSSQDKLTHAELVGMHNALDDIITNLKGIK